jgi:hypothetical protein
MESTFTVASKSFKCSPVVSASRSSFPTRSWLTQDTFPGDNASSTFCLVPRE